MYSRIVMMVLAGVMMLGTTAGILAQEATPSAASLLADLGLPELTLTATDEGLTLSQSRVPAGRYLVTLDNQSRNPTVGVDIVRLIQDDTAWCVDRLPPQCYAWYYRTYVPGGVWGELPQAIMNFPAGDYGFWGTGEIGEEPAAVLTVTGDPAATIDGPEPQAVAIIVSTGEDGDNVALQVEGALRAGPQVVRIVNATARPMFIGTGQEPESSTDDEEEASRPVFDTSSGTFVALDVYKDTSFARETLSIAQSPGTTQWVVLELTPGPLYVAGFLPDLVVERSPAGWYTATVIAVSVAKP